MLEKLHIKDFILIEEINIDFKKGFSVFTGETGAGKSIFIDCLGILIGERMNTYMIRNGCETAVIEGTFSIDENQKQLLKENGYSSEELNIFRSINSAGKSVTRINGKNATLSFVKKVLEDKVDIHCQRDTQYLLQEKNHLQLLDDYISDEKELDELRKLYQKYASVRKKYNDLLNNEYNEAQIEVLKYQINEIEKLHLKSGEEEEIQNTLSSYRQREKNQRTFDKVREYFSGDNSILDTYYEFTKIADQLTDFEEIREDVENLVNSYYSISESWERVSEYIDQDALDTDTIDELNSRLFDIQRIKRKYSSTVDQIIEKYDDMKQQLEAVANRDDILEDLNNEMQAAFSEYEQSAVGIRKLRQKGAKQLEKEILKELSSLNLEHSSFLVEFNEDEPSATGMDAVRFLISTNTGQPLRPLISVASGGELSRLMLGLKTIFTKLQKTSLVVFDEIDTGVSGYVAFNMGLKMKNISRDTQVFSVTHLAAVAAFGDYHYHIEKNQLKDRTMTQLKLLNKDERIRELAIISNSDTSETSVKAAEELYNRAMEAVK